MSIFSTICLTFVFIGFQQFVVGKTFWKCDFEYDDCNSVVNLPNNIPYLKIQSGSLNFKDPRGEKG